MGGSLPVGDQCFAALPPAIGLVVVKKFACFHLRVLFGAKEFLHLGQLGKNPRGAGCIFFRAGCILIVREVFSFIFIFFCWGREPVFSPTFIIVYMFIKVAHFWACMWPGIGPHVGLIIGPPMWPSFEQVMWLNFGPHGTGLFMLKQQQLFRLRICDKIGQGNDGHVTRGISLPCLFVDDVTATIQVLQATYIGTPGADAGKAHDFFAQDGKRILETMIVPYLKQCQVQAYMIGLQARFFPNQCEKGIQVPDVVSVGCGRRHQERLTVFLEPSISLMMSSYS